MKDFYEPIARGVDIYKRICIFSSWNFEVVHEESFYV